MIRKKRIYRIPGVRPLSVKFLRSIFFCRARAAAGGSQLYNLELDRHTQPDSLLFIRIENPEGALPCSPPRKTCPCHVATCIRRRIGIRPCTCARPAASLLPSTSRCLLSLHFFSESAVAETPGRASFSRLHTYIAQEVLSSRFCIFFQLRHMPLSISKRVLGFGTSHATSPSFRDVFLCLSFFLCLSQLLHFFYYYVNTRISL